VPALTKASLTVDPDQTAHAVLNIPDVGEENIELTVKVIDRNGLQQSSTYSLRPRMACLFAFTALGEQGPELRLLDPLVPEPTPLALKHNQGVYDFKFSPDGKHLAYRFGASEAIPEGAHLAVVDLKTLDEQVLSFAEDRIKAFAWSPDSSKLAVAFAAGDSTYLAVAPLSVPGPAKLDGFAAIPAFVEANLYWVGNSFVAYHAARIPDFAHPGQFLGGADNPFDLHTAFYSELGPDGFGEQAWTLDPFPPNVVLQPTDVGFFMITGGEPGTIFTPLPGNGFVGIHPSTSLVSPSGKYSALLDDNSRLQLLTAEGGVDVAPIAIAKANEGCPMPLAWAKGVERIACLADVLNAGGTSTHGELRIFNLKSESEELEMLTLGDFCNDDVSPVNAASCTMLEEGYGYGTNQASGAARAFSSSGRWFAFASVFEGRTILYTADLEVRPPTLKTTSSFDEVGNARLATRLAFSPDERLLLFHSGNKLRLQDPKTGIMRQVLSVTLRGEEKCSDNFSANPNSYCGNAEPPDALRWSPDSRAFAFRTPGALTVIDATESTGLWQKHLQAAECATQCANQFSFQPQLLP
jgi:WD40 repeat protein